MLIERDTELGPFAALAERAARGEGRLVLIEGVAGIGKLNQPVDIGPA